MTTENTEKSTEETDHFLDITGEICPMTFVRTKLLLESMKKGETVLIRLQGEEPLDNVPRNLRDHGEEILSFEREAGATEPHGVHCLRVRKT